MKKSFWLILLSGVLAACTAEPQLTDENQIPAVVSFRASAVESTRTSFDEQTMEVDWAVGDKVAVWATKGESVALRAAEFTATEVGASGATFESLLSQMERGEYTYYSVYPVPSKVSGMTAEFNVPSVQVGEYDCSMDVLVAEPSTALALTQKGAALDLKYRHALHALKIEIPGGVDSYGNTIESVVLDFPCDVAGSMLLDVTGAEAATVSGSKRVTINCNARMSASGVAWAFIAPVDATDQKITISINAAGHTTTFEVDGRSFRAGYASRVIVSMPEALIMEMPRTLIDNNESRATEDPTEATLLVHLRGAESSNIIRTGMEYVTADGQTVTKECRYELGTQNFELSINGLESGVYSMRGFVELAGGEIVYSDWAEGVRVVGNLSVGLGAVNTSYSYYKTSGASVANSKNGETIYTSENTFDINSAFVGEIDEVGVSVDGVNYAGTVTGTRFNVGEVPNQSWAQHTVKAYVVVNGVRFESEAQTAEVTGIPYSVSTKGSSLPNGWSGDKFVWNGSGMGSGDSEKCLRLKAGSKTNQASNGWVVSPAFHIPSSLGVTTTVSNYLYRAVYSTKATIYAAASSGSYSTDTAGGVRKTGVVLFYPQASFANDQFNFTLSQSKPRVTVYANDFSQTTDTWFTVKSISVQYK
ncbi:MAG: hypothetical protein J6K81_06515 [Rikenellaceae bacterium]|nr:hypothetical protein [Rikenellaceae bacterium]